MTGQRSDWRTPLMFRSYRIFGIVTTNRLHFGLDTDRHGRSPPEAPRRRRETPVFRRAKSAPLGFEARKTKLGKRSTAHPADEATGAVAGTWEGLGMRKLSPEPQPMRLTSMSIFDLLLYRREKYWTLNNRVSSRNRRRPRQCRRRDGSICRAANI